MNAQFIIYYFYIFQNIDVVCMPKTGDFIYDKHSVGQCFVTGWGRRTESMEIHLKI